MDINLWSSFFIVIFGRENKDESKGNYCYNFNIFIQFVSCFANTFRKGVNY